MRTEQSAHHIGLVGSFVFKFFIQQDHPYPSGISPETLIRRGSWIWRAYLTSTGGKTVGKNKPRIERIKRIEFV
jgi:hypothetical protein